MAVISLRYLSYFPCASFVCKLDVYITSSNITVIVYYCLAVVISSTSSHWGSNHFTVYYLVNSCCQTMMVCETTYRLLCTITYST